RDARSPPCLDAHGRNDRPRRGQPGQAVQGRRDLVPKRGLTPQVITGSDPGKEAGQLLRGMRRYSPGMSSALAALAFAPGLAVGSFLNVVAARVPLKRSIVRPGPACMACSAPISWHDNIPLVSYFRLRGKCRNCGEKIGAVYPVVELVSALLIVACVLEFGFTFEAAI